MSREDFVLGTLAVLFIAGLVGGFLYLLFFEGDSAMPISGCVVEKTEMATGYSRPRYALKLEIVEGQYINIMTSTRVYFAAVKGGCYEFSGPRNGTSYDGLMERVEQ